MSDQDLLDARREVVESATAILDGRLGVLEGCKQLSTIGLRLLTDRFDDADFSLFDAIASESDNLPTGSERQYWSAEELAQADREIARYEAVVRDDVHAVCRNVLVRFKGQPSGSM